MGKLSKFDLTHEFKSSTEFGLLKPFLYLDCVPGDKHRLSYRFLSRFEPLVAPIMAKVNVYFRYYFVPYRLLTKNFEKCLTNPEDLIKLPMLNEYISGDVDLKSNNLCRAFGLSSSTGFLPSLLTKKVSALPFLAYWLIVNYYYRDRLLDVQYVDHLEPDDFKLIKNFLSVYTVNYPYDYFQRAYKDAQIGSETNLDLNADGTIKVSELRMATKLQELKERLQLSLQRRTGNKYINFLAEFFGTHPNSDLLDIPYYLGGDKDNVNISDVNQTMPTDSSPLGSYAGKAFNTTEYEPTIEFECREHGCLMGLFYFLPDANYTCGVPKEFQKQYFTDFYNPVFAQLGLQEINKFELDAAGNPNSIFGYALRFNELREIPSRIAGNLVEENFWHLGRDVTKETLSDKFRKVNYYNLNRVFAYPSNRVRTNKWKRFDVIGTHMPKTARELVSSQVFFQLTPRSCKEVTDDNGVRRNQVLFDIAFLKELPRSFQVSGASVYQPYSELDEFLNLLASALPINNTLTVFMPIAPQYIGGYANFLPIAGDLVFKRVFYSDIISYLPSWSERVPQILVENAYFPATEGVPYDLEYIHRVLDSVVFYLPYNVQQSDFEYNKFNALLGDGEPDSGDVFRAINVENPVTLSANLLYDSDGKIYVSLPGTGSSLASANYYEYDLVNVIKNQKAVWESRDHIKIAVTNTVNSLRPLPEHYNPQL